ncbi:hypothetical protein E2C01_063691 [Portunus trituberculatus]|uniref:Uncharacterized protein n=1 Tax=Portunus trituberculatus TaxID=210409 RepID=A0A5B7HHR8_PORTR|nr:hypothetical protein [Portunus trituberculatus]
MMGTYWRVAVVDGGEGEAAITRNNLFQYHNKYVNSRRPKTPGINHKVSRQGLLPQDFYIPIVL